MPKLDKSLYSKEEAARLMNERRKEKRNKLEDKIQDVPVPYLPPNENKYYVLCLKHGTKYSSEYVNILYRMVKRNCSLDIEFVCLTDNTKGLDSNIKTIPLPEYLEGWWCKPYMFSNDLGLNGTILYMDLDVVIADNIDHLFTFEPDRWCTIRDFTRKMRPTWQKYNSSVIRFKSGTLDYFWQDFKRRQKDIQRKYHGDQDWLYVVANGDNPAKLFPDLWIQSWKWEIRQSKDLVGGRRGERKLRTVEHVTPPKGCCITVFHGDPNPEHCDDPWVKDNWK